MINFPLISKVFSRVDKHPSLPAVGLWLRASWAPGRVTFLDSWVCRLWIWSQGVLEIHVTTLSPLRKPGCSESRERTDCRKINRTVNHGVSSLQMMKYFVFDDLFNWKWDIFSWMNSTRSLATCEVCDVFEAAPPRSLWQASRRTVRNNRGCFC